MIRIRPRPPRARQLFPFALALALFLAPAASFAFTPNGGIEGINPVAIVPEFPCNTEDVRLVFTICTCNARFGKVQRIDETHARLDIDVNPLVVCVQCRPDTLGLDLGRFAEGSHVMNADIAQHIVAGPDSGQVRVEHYVLDFDVHSCPEPPNPIPYVTGVEVTAYCDSCTQDPCEGDSIYVRFEGMFPDACTRVVDIRAIPSPVASPSAGPDVIRITYENVSACTTCGQAFVTWSAALPIRPLPQGTYRLPVETYLVDGCRGGSPQFLGGSAIPFDVRACRPPAACAVVEFPSDLSERCDAFVAPDLPGEAKLHVAAPRPVGGVQGRLQFDRPGLRIVGIDPVFPGTVLKWDRDPDGASFVAVFPPAIPIPLTATGFPFINVRFALEPGAAIAEPVRLTPVDILVSDFDGIRIDPCVTTAYGQPPALRICQAKGCDFNHDGHSDVRDLVLQAGCLYRRSVCPFDIECNDDGVRNLDDVLCCARRILGGPRPDSANAVAAPEVTVQLGAPIAVEGGIDVPVRVTARARLGAARLSFTYPDAAFASAAIELAEGGPSWLVLDEGGGGSLRMGAIRIGDDLQVTAEVDAPLLLTLHLRTRAGQAAAGSLAFVAGDFAAPDGAVLRTSASPLSMPLGGGIQLAVSAPRPNPFGGETRFAVALTQNAELDVAVYELNGRKVATLWKGMALAGTRDLVWRRTRDDGTIVPSGVYFIRATSGGTSRGAKVLVLSRN